MSTFEKVIIDDVVFIKYHAFFPHSNKDAFIRRDQIVYANVAKSNVEIKLLGNKEYIQLQFTNPHGRDEWFVAMN